MTIFIAETHRHFIDWCIDHDRDPNDKEFVVFSSNTMQPMKGRMRRDGDQIIVLGHPSDSYLTDVAMALVPCGFERAQTRDGHPIDLRYFVRMNEANKSNDALRQAQQRLAQAQEEVKRAQAQLSAALMAVGPFETLARELWLLLEVARDAEIDDDEREFYEKLRSDVGERDRCWQSLLIDTQRDEWRRLAQRVFELAQAFEGEL